MGSVSIEQIDKRTRRRVRQVQSGRRRGRTFRDRESRAPLVSENIQTDAAVRIDIGMVDASGEVDLGRLERVVGREVDR